MSLAKLNITAHLVIWLLYLQTAQPPTKTTPFSLEKCNHADAAGRLRWVGMSALTVLPITCWSAWLLAAWAERDDALRVIYIGYAVLYVAPLVQFTDGFSHVGPLAGACWLACALHVQIHRILRTNGVL